MIHIDDHADARWLNRSIKETVGDLTFTPEQEAAIKKLVLAVAAGAMAHH